MYPERRGFREQYPEWCRTVRPIEEMLLHESVDAESVLLAMVLLFLYVGLLHVVADLALLRISFKQVREPIRNRGHN